MRMQFYTATAALLLTACGGSEPAPGGDGGAATDSAATMTTPEVGKVARAASIAKALQAQPDSARAILERNGMDAGGWGALMVEIAADPAMSQAFQEALGGS